MIRRLLARKEATGGGGFTTRTWTLNSSNPSLFQDETGADALTLNDAAPTFTADYVTMPEGDNGLISNAFVDYEGSTAYFIGRLVIGGNSGRWIITGYRPGVSGAPADNWMGIIGTASVDPIIRFNNATSSGGNLNFGHCVATEFFLMGVSMYLDGGATKQTTFYKDSGGYTSIEDVNFDLLGTSPDHPLNFGGLQTTSYDNPIDMVQFGTTTQLITDLTELNAFYAAKALEFPTLL